MTGAGDVEIRAENVREVLARLLSSRSFARSHQLRRFLERTVAWTLAGRADEIKETTIAIDAPLPIQLGDRHRADDSRGGRGSKSRPRSTA